MVSAEALSRLSFGVAQEDLLLLTGPIGCGKSVALAAFGYAPGPATRGLPRRGAPLNHDHEFPGSAPGYSRRLYHTPYTEAPFSPRTPSRQDSEGQLSSRQRY